MTQSRVMFICVAAVTAAAWLLLAGGAGLLAPHPHPTGADGYADNASAAVAAARRLVAS